MTRLTGKIIGKLKEDLNANTADTEECVKFDTKNTDISMFFREVFNLIAAEHPAVVPVTSWNCLGVSPDNETQKCVSLCFLRPKYPTTLACVLDNPEEAAKLPKAVVLYGIARAMQHLHSLSISHRNLTLSNIFLDKDYRPYVGGLTWSKRGDIHVASDTIMKIDQIYEAPERSDKLAGPPADVWSFGAIVWQIVNNRSVNDPDELLETSSCPVVKEMRSVNPEKRIAFDRICRMIEKGVFHELDGADKLVEYKELLDKYESEVAERYEKEWLTNLNAAQTFSAEIVVSIVKAAYNRDRDAAACAAILYLMGCGVEKSILKAAKFASLAYDALHGVIHKIVADDPCGLGEYLETGGEIARAYSSYKESARKGDARALWRLGALLIYNSKTPRVDEGLELLNLAAKHDISDAFFELGCLYMKGRFVTRRHGEAIRNFEEALKRGHRDAAVMLARIYHKRGDFVTAEKYYSIVLAEHFDVLGEAQISGDALRTFLRVELSPDE